MMIRAASAALIGWVAAATAQPGGVDAAALGKPAPILDVQEWVRGEPIGPWETGRVYVIDFWATWCRPCIEAVPHLNALAAEFADRPVTFIGFSSADSRGNSLERTRDFAVNGAPGARGERVPMEYSIAWARGRGTWQRYAQSGWDQSIPHVFIINAEGVLAWHGHPAEMDDVLVDVVEGTFDVTAHAAEEARRAELKAKAAPLTREMTDKFRAGDVNGAIDLAGRIAEMDGVLFASIASWRYERLVQASRADEATAYAAGLIEGAWKDSPAALFSFAHRLSGRAESGADEGSLALALRAAERANELTKGRRLNVLEVLARIYGALNDRTKERGAVEAALEVAPESEREGLRARLIELGGTPREEKPEAAPETGGG